MIFDNFDNSANSMRAAARNMNEKLNTILFMLSCFLNELFDLLESFNIFGDIVFMFHDISPSEELILDLSKLGLRCLAIK